MAKCKACGIDLTYIRMKSGRLMPVSGPRITIVTDRGDVLTGRESHYASCPGANKHRKPITPRIEDVVAWRRKDGEIK
jgi:hypothetical protein